MEHTSHIRNQMSLGPHTKKKFPLQFVTQAFVHEHGSAVHEHGSIVHKHESAVREHGSAVQEHGSAVHEHGSAVRNSN
jgi:hypothetical protein